MLYLLLLASLAVAAPISVREIIIPAKYFKDSFVIYSGSHDIVEITVPLNELNYAEGSINDSNRKDLDYIFFVEADQNTDGTKDYKGAYVYHGGEAKMIMEKGQTVTFAKKYKIYIGASDGIYMYNHNDNSVKKYGSETKSVIKMAVDVHNELVYYLTSDYVLHKLDKEGTSTEVHDVKDVRDFVCDFAGNLFYYDGSKNFFAYNGRNVVKIEGLSGPKKVFFMNTPMDNLAYTVVDGALYKITIEGRSEYQNLKYEVLPIAYATDFTVFQYYSYNKKIYYFNTLTMEQKVSKQEYEEHFEGAEKIKTIAKATCTNQL